MFVTVSQDWSLRFTWSQENRVDGAILFALRDHSSSWDVQMMSRIVHLLDVSLNSFEFPVIPLIIPLIDF